MSTQRVFGLLALTVLRDYVYQFGSNVRNIPIGSVDEQYFYSGDVRSCLSILLDMVCQVL